MLRTEKNDMSESNLYILTHQDQCNFASFPGITSSPLMHLVWHRQPQRHHVIVLYTLAHVTALFCSSGVQWHRPLLTPPATKPLQVLHYYFVVFLDLMWCHRPLCGCKWSEDAGRKERQFGLGLLCVISISLPFTIPSNKIYIDVYLYLYWFLYNEK